MTLNKHDFIILPKAQKEIRKLTRKSHNLNQLFVEATEAIITNPYNAGQEKTGDLAGIYSYDIRHQRISYELAYYLEYDDNGDLVIIIAAGTRENFYDSLKKYIQSSGIKPTK